MRLIYFEDDAIDQRLFKRASKNIAELDITYHDSCMGLEEDYINSFDGIIIDQYLRDCSAIQFKNKNITIPMAVLSASDTLHGSEEGFIGVWQKPIKENLLQEIIKKLGSKTSTSTISFEYIDELTDGDETEKKELLETIYKSIEDNNQALEDYDQLDAHDIQQYLHKQKSKIGIFYLDDLHKKIDAAENSLKNGATKEIVKPAVDEVRSAVSSVLLELKKHLN